MQYDIFISYSHHDNETHGGWVRQFHDRLLNDFRSRSGKKLSVFLDEEGLRTGAVLSSRLKDALAQSALFIPILSPAYLDSSWCRREFLHFMEAAGDKLLVGSNCRILPVQLMPFARYEADDEDGRQEVNRIAGFLKDNEILYADFYQHPLPLAPAETDFAKKIAGLSDDVFALLKDIQAGLQKGASDQHTEAPAIFLGYAANDCKELRDSLLKELQQQRKYGKIPHRILPDEAPDAPGDPKSLPAGELEAFLRKQLNASVFSVHLFGDSEGQKTADGAERIPHLQYRLAVDMASTRPDFFVFTAESEPDERATQQEEFLKIVAEDARRNPRIEGLPAFELKPIKDSVLEHIQVMEKQPPPPENDNPRRVFFVHDHRDKEDPIRNRIDDLIYGQQFDVFVPVFREDDPHIDPDASFRDFWLVCNKAIVLLRNASTAWCNAMKVELIKTSTEKKPPYEMAICVAEPDVAQRIREVRSHEFRIIDCAHEGFEQEIVQFLKASRHA